MDELGIISILGIAVGLSADCFAVALGASVTARRFMLNSAFRLAIAFGVFQTAMCLLGWALGQTIVQFIESFDHWVAFALLAGVGGKMIWESFHEKDEEGRADPTRGWLLITLAIATSIDSLAVGLSFAFLQVNIALASGIIGAMALIITVLAYAVGTRVGKLAGRWAETIGGIILIGIGLRIVLEHLL